MKKILATILATTMLASAPAMAFKTGNPAAGDGTVRASQESFASAQKLLKIMNKSGGYARDFYRNTFMQLMGLVYFDPNTPDITACEKDILNYHLPEITRRNLDFPLLIDDLSTIMSQVYTEDELRWMQDFYNSPFGARMLRKQLQFNERIVRELANKYGHMKPEFTKLYGTMAQRCQGAVPRTPADAPRGDVNSPTSSDLLNIPSVGTSPVAISPEPAR